MIVLQITLDALGQSMPRLNGKFLPRLKADHLVLANLELNAALLAAEAAVGLHQPFGRLA